MKGLYLEWKMVIHWRRKLVDSIDVGMSDNLMIEAKESLLIFL
jgi:hypothetical protein